MAVDDSTQSDPDLFTKRCTRCKKTKPLSEFGPDPRKRLGVSYRCRTCNAAESRKSRQRRPGSRRGIHLQNRYGISRAEYDAIHAEQQGLCAICERPERTADHRTGKPRYLSVDHDHTTGEVRGLLCRACNYGIGVFEDNLTLVLQAVAYLTRHQARTRRRA